MAIAIGNLDDMLFFPYNSVHDEPTGFDDRLYDSQDWADYFKQFIGNGIFPNPSNGLKIESLNNSMVLTIRIGAAFANGRLYMQKKDFDFNISPAHLTLGRRDIVVCRHDTINRTMQILYIDGTPASLPIVPSIVRTDDIFDLKLCEITVNPNVQAITQSNILDTRLNSGVCGIVHGLVNQVDTTDVFNQYQAFLDENIAYWSAYQGQRIADFDADYEEFRALLAALETQSFTLINNNFDDWSVKRGCRYRTEFSPGSIKNTITVKATGMLLAEKITTYPEGEIVSTINFYPWSLIEDGNTTQTTRFTITKKTTFLAGSIESEVI